MVFLALISIVYGGFLPAGLFIYWITANIFTIAQQYLIVGWGGMFPLFGWTPAFAAEHTPRFPVAMPPPPDPSKRAAILTDADKKTTAEKTIRPRERGRQGRRGRRRRHEGGQRGQRQDGRGGPAGRPRGVRGRPQRPRLRDPDPGQPGCPRDGSGTRPQRRRAA